MSDSSQFSHGTQTTSEFSILQNKKRAIKSDFKKYRVESGCAEQKTELDKYLSEDLDDDDDDDFNILDWWKVNSHRFPILSQLARDVLAMPVSTVASESAFSTGGRVLDAYRSSLTPKVAQALICAQDWLREPSNVCDMKGEMEELDKIDLGNILNISLYLKFLFINIL